jgi:hypothetical protein
MTATAPEQIQFMQSAGMPLTTEAHKTFTGLARPTHIAYRSLVDFVPGVEPHEVIEAVEAMHDAAWTDRLMRAARTSSTTSRR